MAEKDTNVGPQAIIVARFETAGDGHDALKVLKSAHRKEHLHISDGALLRKNEKGRVRVVETGDWSGAKGAAIGGIAGAALGVITGGVGFLALGGAAIVGLTSKLRDSGFDNQQLRAITDQLDPDSSAVLVVCDEGDADRCVEILRHENAIDLYRVTLDMELSTDLYIERLELSHKDEVSTV